MPTPLVEALALEHPPVAVVHTDERPEQGVQFKEGTWGCVASMLLAATRGKTAVFDRRTFGCPGGGAGLGFAGSYEGFDLASLLADGSAGRPGERFFADRDLSGRWLAQLPDVDVPAEYVVVKPLEALADGETPSLVFFLANADQLSALIFLANYRRGAREPVTAPWSAACQSLVFALDELERDEPRGVIGFFDISQRHRVDRDVLSFTVPWGLYREMEGNVAGSFLGEEPWLKIRGR